MAINEHLTFYGSQKKSGEQIVGVSVCLWMV
jgi:hypothetical protein